MAEAPITRISVRIGGFDGPVKEFRGRVAWALAALVQAGSAGVTPIDRPAPRWSHYTFMLRRAGVPVLTLNERHGGAYAGHHARYLLTGAVEVLSCNGDAE